MSASATTQATGHKTIPLWASVGSVTIVIIVLGYLIWHFWPTKDSPLVTQRQKFAGGNIGPTMDVLTNGKSAEQKEAERRQLIWQRSLNLPPESQAQRASEQSMPDAPETKPTTRTAKEVAVGESALLSDVRAALSAPLTGTSGTPAGATDGVNGGGSPAGNKGAPVAPPYMSFDLRQQIAQSDAGAKGEKTGRADSTGADPVTQVLLDVPSDVLASHRATAIAAEAAHKPPGPTMPVNILPPYTVPLHCSFDQNLVVGVAGGNSNQRIVVSLEQDVYARNRLQLPRGVKLIGTTTGVRDLDLVDITFDSIQFPDLTMVKITGKAYQPVTSIAPNDYGLQGVMGDYEEPSIPRQMVPVFLAVAQGVAKGNLQRLAAAGVQVVPGPAGGSSINVPTSDRDRMYGGAEAGLDKIVSMMLSKMARYSPRVRIKAGAPLIILLDDYVDISKRSLMGHEDPLKQVTAAPFPVSEGPGGPAPLPTETPDTPEVRAKIAEAIKKLPPDQVKQLSEMANAKDSPPPEK